MATDTEMATDIRDAAKALNDHITKAREEGLRVELSSIDHYIRSYGEDPDEPHHLVHVKVLRRV